MRMTLNKLSCVLVLGELLDLLAGVGNRVVAHLLQVHVVHGGGNLYQWADSVVSQVRAQS